MLKRTSHWLVLATIFFSATTTSASEWSLELERDGVRVYSQPVAGSPLKAVRGVAIIRGSLGRLTRLLLDPSLRTRWDKFLRPAVWRGLRN